MKCSICNLEIDVGPGDWAYGHNAEPVNDGRCCSQCNAVVVVPARMNLISSTRRKQEAGE
jgi:hypothetical protein